MTRLRWGPGVPDVEALSAVPGFHEVGELVLHGATDVWGGDGPAPVVDAARVRALFRRPLAHLHTLRMPLQGLGPDAARALVGADLPSLQHLDLRGNDLGDEGARVVIEGFPQLAVLDLRHNGLSDVEKDALAELTSVMVWL